MFDSGLGPLVDREVDVTRLRDRAVQAGFVQSFEPDNDF